MDVQTLRTAFALIAYGLVEKNKLLTAEPSRYPHSARLQHGINMFLAASVELGKVGEEIWDYADEAGFLEHFACIPVNEWFGSWDEAVKEDLHLTEQPFYGFGPLAVWTDDNQYSPSEDCMEYLDSVDSDILSGTEERLLYEMMAKLSQDHYTLVREFIIRHPLVSPEGLRDIKFEFSSNPSAIEALNFAYEEFSGEVYRCPSCGWTMTIGKYGPICHSRHCTDIAPALTDEMKIDPGEGLLRLKKGVMRYFAQPGKLELEIADFCKQLGLSYTLWPMMDTYDIEILFPDGEIWELDAKAYRNPIALRNKVSTDQAFNRDGFDRGYYVIPSEFVQNNRRYTKIVNEALKGNKQVSCITSYNLKTKIREKAVQINEEK